MWCDYEDSLCLNPLCLGGCVSLKNDREHKLNRAKLAISVLKLSADKEEGETK